MMRLGVLMSLAGAWQRETALRLAELGHAVTIVTFDRPRGEQQYLSVDDAFQRESIDALRRAVEGLHVLDTRSTSGLRYFSSGPKLRRVLRDAKAEALLTLYGGGHATAAYVSRFRPYSVYGAGTDILMATGFRRWMARRTLGHATPLFVNGRYLSERARLLAPEAEVVPVYVGVDTDVFRPGTPPDEPVRVICTRGFAPVYDNAAIVRGLAEMGSPDREVQVTFLAGGPLLDETRALADRLLPRGLRDAVSFEGGASRDRVAEALASSLVYVSMSRSDGASVSLMEAMACGLYPVLSDIPANREWIDEGAANGLLVPVNDPRALGEALARAIDDAHGRARARTFNLSMAAERVDARRNMAFLAEELERRVRASRPS
jgi:glycosyltransferase involved in cell wall biosynthesis